MMTLGLISTAVFLFLADILLSIRRTRRAEQRGYDRGKADGIIEGWKNMPERDSRGRYKAKAKVVQ